MSMCCLVSAFGTATYNTAKFITNILQNCCGKTSSFVKDSIAFHPENQNIFQYIQKKKP